MPKGAVKDEAKWDKAKKLAADQGHAEEYDYIMGIYKKMTKSIKLVFKRKPEEPENSLEMETLEKAIESWDNEDMVLWLNKGKGLPVGTIREWKGKKHIKTAQGWKPHKEGKKTDTSPPGMSQTMPEMTDKDWEEKRAEDKRVAQAKDKELRENLARKKKPSTAKGSDTMSRAEIIDHFKKEYSNNSMGELKEMHKQYKSGSAKGDPKKQHHAERIAAIESLMALDDKTGKEIAAEMGKKETEAGAKETEAKAAKDKAKTWKPVEGGKTLPMDKIPGLKHEREGYSYKKEKAKSGIDIYVIYDNQTGESIVSGLSLKEARGQLGADGAKFKTAEEFGAAIDKAIADRKQREADKAKREKEAAEAEKKRKAAEKEKEDAIKKYETLLDENAKAEEKNRAGSPQERYDQAIDDIEFVKETYREYEDRDLDITEFKSEQEFLDSLGWHYDPTKDKDESKENKLEYLKLKAGYQAARDIDKITKETQEAEGQGFMFKSRPSPEELQKALSYLRNEDQFCFFNKGAAMPVGTTRQWKGSTYVKTAQGWKPKSEAKAGSDKAARVKAYAHRLVDDEVIDRSEVADMSDDEIIKTYKQHYRKSRMEKARRLRVGR